MQCLSVAEAYTELIGIKRRDAFIAKTVEVGCPLGTCFYSPEWLYEYLSMV